MLPMTAGFLILGPVSGWLSDRYGARVFSTLGMIIAAVAFLVLTTFSYDFDYLPFAIVILVMGLAMGLFASPNTASIMNSVPPEQRGSASGMRSTLNNSGGVIGMSILFTITLIVLASNLPPSINTALTSAGAAQLIPVFYYIPPTSSLFAAFLGYNPIQTLLSQLPSSVTASVSSQVLTVITGSTWFPLVIATPLMSALDVAFYFNASLALAAAVASLLRGKKYVYGLIGEVERASESNPKVHFSKDRTVEDHGRDSKSRIRRHPRQKELS
jgi:MFS family permease